MVPSNDDSLKTGLHLVSNWGVLDGYLVIDLLGPLLGVLGLYEVPGFELGSATCRTYSFIM